MATNMNNFTKGSNVFKRENGAGIISNLEVGGQLGFGLQAGALDAATPLVLPPAVIYVTQTPHMWDMLEEDRAIARVVKSLFETHAKSVSGIDIGYTLESEQKPVGHDGQQMDAPTVSKRTQTQPNFTWTEITGNLVFRVIQTWIWDICDPDTQISMSRLSDTQLMPFTMSAYSLSFIALQFDQTMDHNRLLGAVYITNVYPTATNEFGIKRDIGQAQAMDRSISFTGLAIENSYIYSLGRAIAEMISYRSGSSGSGDPYSSEGKFGVNVSDDAGIVDEVKNLSTKYGAEFGVKTPPGPNI